ncbi:MAG: elongation factor P [Pseudomonadota bacterium]|nr:elongation factor P [Pseudomonadota bacterium]
MKISTSQFKNGLKIIINDQPCSIIEHEFHKPGKGQAVMRVKFRNLITDKVIDRTYKSGESVEEADILTVEMSYLYTDGEFWHFMNPSTYEQIEIPSKIIGNSKKWLVGQECCEVVIWDNEPISIEPPPFVELVIAKSDPGIKGDTVSGASKPAELETGITIQVPLFVEEGEKIKVDTRSGEYSGRV